MTFENIIDLVAGETGAIAILLFILFLLLNGKIVSKDYVDDLKSTNKLLIQSLQEQSDSIETLTETAVESLENSKTTLRILTEARNATGVRGEPLDE